MNDSTPWPGGNAPQSPILLQMLPVPNTITEADIHAMVCKWLRDDPAIRAILNGDRDEDGLVDAHQHRRVELREEDGSMWRGTLYRVEKERVL